MDTQDYTVYLDRIKRYYNRYPFFLYAYALMSNHIHLAIETCEIPLSKIMQGIQQSYAQYVHKKYSSVGRVFQGPYGAVLYDKVEFTLNLVRYIHRNPIEARLVENPVEYPWSSHRIYMMTENCSFLDKKFVLEMFPCDVAKSMQRFNEFVLKGPQDLEDFNFDDVRDRQVIGNKEFVEKVNTKIEISSVVPETDFSNNFSVIRKKTLSEILKIVSKQTKVSADSILSPSRIRTITETRRMFAFIAAKYAGYRLVGISKFLKLDATTISKMVNKVEEELKHNSILSEKLRKIIHVLQARPRS